MSSLIPSRFRYELEDLIDNSSEPLEIEARLRNLTENQIKRLLDYLKDFKRESSYTIDYYVDDKRVTERNGQYFMITKTAKLKPKIIIKDDINLKISVAYESDEKQVIKPKKFSRKRIKDRTSYFMDNYRIDITKVNDNEVNITEVELEVLDSKKFNADDFTEKIESLYNIMKDTDSEAISFLSSSLLNQSNIKDGNVVRKALSQARDLGFYDMTRDGLLRDYTVSLKADGLLKLMIFFDNKVYLFAPLKGAPSNALIYLANSNLSNKTIIVGEWVKKENHQYEEEYIYLPFDCLFYKNEDMRNNNYLDRLSYLADFYEEVIGNTKIIKKPLFTYPAKNEEFYATCRQALDVEKEAKFDTDGLIFTPINSPYITAGQKLPENKKRDRVLAKYPDVCKFKRPEDLTIDFLVKKDGLYSNTGKFEGSLKYPFTKDNYVVEDKYLNKVVEFAPERIKDKIIYRPYRIRTDKLYPNKISQILDNWVLFHNPITEATITGKDISLMRRYLNQVKGQLLSSINGLVIDIGAGAGGVFDKYTANKKIGKVLGIEPNKEHLLEFERRRENLKNPSQFDIIEAGGENTEKIIQAAKSFFPADFEEIGDLNICFNISLSFFWKDKAMLEALNKTITEIEKLYQERNGTGSVKIVYLTIEGERFKRLFQERGNNIELNNIILRKISNNEVYVDIKGSVTVHQQKEYFVYLKELWSLSGYYPLEEKVANNSDFILSEPELTWANLFVYGKAIRSNNKANSESEIEKSENEECLPVNEKSAQRTKYGLRSVGDDKRVKLKGSLYRLACMKTPARLYHALLKTLNDDYLEANVYERHKLAKDLRDRLRSSKDLEYISNQLDVGIKVINENKIYGKDKKRFIILYKCDNDYEAVICYDGQDHSVFKSNSMLLN